ncbi:MAG TPA: carbamate kinase, partial [Anaerovoracaceae bacterium]|nr:carbamate kinase [Anaerovoracaceae bacterium]
MRKIKKVVIALGGNALQSGTGPATAAAQLEVVKHTCKYIADISNNGYEMAIVHGNGPQIGRILLATESSRNLTPVMPFDVCGAMSQGYIGYHIQQALSFALKKIDRHVPVVTLTTQVVVDYHDKGF